MTPEQLQDKRREILGDVFYWTPDKGDLPFEQALKALDTLETEANAELQTRIQALEAENTSLKAPLVAVRFTRNENPYGDVYYTAKVGYWEIELNPIPSRYKPFYLTVGRENQQSLDEKSMDDLITLLMASRIYSARINGLETK